MKIFRDIILTGFIVCCMHGFAQEDKTVEVKGVGMNRTEAVSDALRTAVGAAMGVAVTAETQMENFVVLKDAISTRSEGYVTGYEVLEETPLSNRFEVKVRASVSLAPLKQDAQSLSQMLGGLRFIVLYDPRNLDEEEVSYCEYAYERINEKLSEKKYKHTEASLFQDILKIYPENDTSEISFLNRMALYTESEFIIQIKKLNIQIDPKAGGLTSARVIMEVKAFDACNFMGLGTVLFESTPILNTVREMAVKAAISEAVNNYFDRLLYLFLSDIGSWVNTGAPYELRFYTEIRYNDFIPFKNKLKSNPAFGGEMTLHKAGNYQKVTLNFKLKQDEMIDEVMTALYEVPNMQSLDLEPQLIFGRQVSFAPYTQNIPEATEKEDVLKRLGRQ
ncbi:MAG: hypothetical protein JW861_14515 [Bacteroidales bacterium]|nr:hypothetical protein [Bacteroidales bacterium]